MHAKLVADTMLHAGIYEFVKKGDAPVVGITKLDGVTLEELKRPRRKVPLGSVQNIASATDQTASSPPSISPEV